MGKMIGGGEKGSATTKTLGDFLKSIHGWLIVFFFFLISKKIYIQKEPHESIKQNREYREGHKQREEKEKTRKQTKQTKN